MPSVLKRLHEREISSLSRNETRPYPTFRSYSLLKIMPAMAQEDIFLGFSACDTFLISYKAEFKRYLLRFWLFPPSSSLNDQPRLKLFSDMSFSRITYASQFHEAPCVRFIQSVLRPDTFFFLSCDYDGTGLVTAFASMPDPSCSACIAYSTFFKTYNGAHQELSPQCVVHSRVLLLNLDLTPSPLSPFHFNQPDYSAVTVESDQNSTLDSLTPPCYQFRLSRGGGKKQNKCCCFFSVNSLIGQVQVGVCPISGCLQLAWPSPDSQVKVLSCCFQDSKDIPEAGLRTFPMTAPTRETLSADAEGRLFALHQPVLTHNYCSTCYSWPEAGHSPVPVLGAASYKENRCGCLARPRTPPRSFYPRNGSSSSSSRQTACNPCLFICQPRRFQRIAEPSHWIETEHTTHQRPAASSDDKSSQSGHKKAISSETDGGLACLCSKKRTRPQQPAPSLLLTSRPSVVSCHQSTYLAMLQDIRASYINWNLVARPASLTSRRNAYVEPPMALHLELPLDDLHWLTPSRRSSRSSSVNTSSGSDQLSTFTSPLAPLVLRLGRFAGIDESSHGLTPSDDLLVHRLSGQCHTSFNQSDWQELNTNTIPDGNNRGSSGRLHRQAIAHLEEVVFDIPFQPDADNPYRSPTGLLVLLPPDEPNLLLIYSCQPREQWPTPCRSKLRTASLISSPVCLISVIDLLTGRRVLIPPGNADLEVIPLVSRRLTVGQLGRLTRRCPMARSESRPQLLHELNNFHMLSSQDSLKVLENRQGGYAIHW